MKEEGQESDHEDEEDGDDAPLDPLEDGLETVAAALAGELVTVPVVLAQSELLGERSHVDDCKEARATGQPSCSRAMDAKARGCEDTHG